MVTAVRNIPAQSSKSPSSHTLSNNRSNMFGSKPRDYSSNLPPRAGEIRTSATKATPIFLRTDGRSAFDVTRNGGDTRGGTLKANNSKRFNSFKPMNNLTQPGARQRRPEPLRSSLRHDSVIIPSLNVTRKKIHSLDDESEDELARPGLPNLSSSSPKKRQRLSPKRANGAEDSQHIEQRTLSPSRKCPTYHSGGDQTEQVSQVLATPRQKRDQKRLRLSAPNKFSRQKNVEKTMSPYFKVENENEIGDPRIKGGISIVESAKDLSGFSRPIIADLKEKEVVTLDDQETHQQQPSNHCSQVMSPDSAPRNELSQHQRKLSRSPEKKMNKIRAKSENAWYIKSLYTEQECFEDGKIRLTVNSVSKDLKVHVNDKMNPYQAGLSEIHQLVFSKSFLRFHFRGRGAIFVWIKSLNDVGSIVDGLLEIDHTIKWKEETDERMEKIFQNWRKGCPQRRSLGNAASTGASVSRPWLNRIITSSRIDPISQSTNHGIVLRDASSSSKRKETRRMKLSERLQNSTPDHAWLKSAHTRTPKENQLMHGELSDLISDNDTVDEVKMLNDVDQEKSTFNPITTDQKVELDMGSDVTPKSTLTPQTINPQRATRITRSNVSYIDQETSQETRRVEKYSVAHGLGEPWSEPLIYPRAGKKRVIVEFNDLLRLDNEEYLNDNLVEFALRWLRHQADDPPNIYWFSTYFFDKLTKGRGKKIDYEGVKKWTKDIDLFSYDYVVVPVNEDYHWWLAIICNLPALKESAKFARIDEQVEINEDYEPKELSGSEDINLHRLRRRISIDRAKTKFDPESPYFIDSNPELGTAGIGPSHPEIKGRGKPRARVRDPSLPTIVALDSLGISRSQAVASLKSYLKEEAMDRWGLDWNRDEIAGMTAKGIPYQSNLSDCGLYLLGYAETMLRDCDDFIHKLLLKEFDAENDWVDLVPSVMRTRLRQVIQKRHDRQIRLPSPGQRKVRKDSTDSSDSSTTGLLSKLKKVSLHGSRQTPPDLLHNADIIDKNGVGVENDFQQSMDFVPLTSSPTAIKDSQSVQTNSRNELVEAPFQPTRPSTPSTAKRASGGGLHGEPLDDDELEIPETPQASPRHTLKDSSAYIDLTSSLRNE